MQIVNFSDTPNVKQFSLFQRMKTMETCWVYAPLTISFQKIKELVLKPSINMPFVYVWVSMKSKGEL